MFLVLAQVVAASRSGSTKLSSPRFLRLSCDACKTRKVPAGMVLRNPAPLMATQSLFLVVERTSLSSASKFGHLPPSSEQMIGRVRYVSWVEGLFNFQNTNRRREQRLNSAMFLDKKKQSDVFRIR